MLGVCQFRPSLRRLTGMLQIAAGIAAITFLELGDCHGGRYGRPLRMSRIGSSDKLVCTKQADYDEATCELCLSQATVFTRK